MGDKLEPNPRNPKLEIHDRSLATGPRSSGPRGRVSQKTRQALQVSHGALVNHPCSDRLGSNQLCNFLASVVRVTRTNPRRELTWISSCSSFCSPCTLETWWNYSKGDCTPRDGSSLRSWWYKCARADSRRARFLRTARESRSAAYSTDSAATARESQSAPQSMDSAAWKTAI